MLDGKSRQISIYNNRCHGEDTPFGELDVTDIEITHNKHDVNMINKNFLNVKITADVIPTTTATKTVVYKDATTSEDITANETVCIDGNPTYANDPSDFYIGWKNSSECITEMQVFNNNMETGYHQIFQDRENYLENMKYKTKTEKDRAGRNCHLCFTNLTEGEKPGIILKKDDYLKRTQTETTVTFDITKKLKDNKVMPLKDGVVAEIGGTKDSFSDLTADNLKLAYFKLAKGDYTENTDVMLHYDYKVDLSGKYHSTASDGSDTQEHDSEAALIAALKSDPTRIPDADDDPKTFTYITQRVYEAESTPIEIPLIIPIKDLVAFRSMDEVEKQFGKITLRLMFGHRSMVYSVIKAANDISKITQINDQASGITLSVNNFRVVELNCDCYGYNLGSPAMLASGDSPRIYETRYTDFKNYDGNMIDGKFHIEFPYPLTMVKDIHLTFPRKNFQTTVFTNPELKDVQFKIDGILYPRNTPLDTTSMRFQHMQVDDTDADDDVRYSYINGGDKYDNTNFLMTYNLSDGPFYGVNTERENVNIIFTGTRKGSDYGSTDNEPNPQIWFTRDAYWSLDTDNGLRFFNDRAPINDVSEIRYMK